MPIKVVDVESILARRDAPLSLTKLYALNADVRDAYTLMALQPPGVIEANTQRIGHADRNRGRYICKEFLEKAVAEYADIAIAPEYCVPWDLVSNIIDGDLRPGQGAIWILGCESITPTDLCTLAVKANSDPGVFFHSEELNEREIAHKKYIDPLVYAFWSRDANDQYVFCIFVQMKTAPCRDYHDVEHNSLYLGTELFVFNRQVGTISLSSLICSDAFEIQDVIDEIRHSALLFHIQLNPKPAHSDYATYRSHLVSVASNSDVELMCVNWAENVEELKEGCENEKWRNVAGSAWYAPQKRFSADDQEIDSLHHAGLYYSVLRQRWHALFLNYEPQILMVSKQKVFFTGDQSLLPRTFVTIIKRWAWNSEGSTWVTASTPSDGFNLASAAYPAAGPDLDSVREKSPMAVERALEILVGPAGKAKTWHLIAELPSMQLSLEEESIRRITVHQDVAPDRPGVIFRRQRLQRAEDALSFKSMDFWPPRVRDLADGYSYAWNKKQPHFNIRSTKQVPAALVYLSDESDDQVLEAAKVKMQVAMMDYAASLCEKDSRLVPEDELVRALDRLCVVYRRYGQLKFADGISPPHIARDPGASASDIGSPPND